jgi:cytoskeletal protein RodZ
MSTGTVIGIVVGIIVAVALVAILIMFVLRRRRDNDEDPLSPFELSMDKGYSATPGFAPQNSYNPRADAAAAVAARDQQLESGSRSINTPGTGAAAAAGIAYSGFYDQQTSPEAAAAARPYQAQYTTQSSADSYATGAPANTGTNGTNLWLSAMEPKENDSYLSAHESADDNKSEHSHLSSRNSYDAAGNNDASSEISGASDLNSGKDFPDYEEHGSSRGSYEL